jgi:hypothetical protein
MFMKLSEKAIKDLRIALKKTYGENFESSLTKDEVNRIGDLLLTILAESLKIKNQQKT